jgi:hypothetical protein
MDGAERMALHDEQEDNGGQTPVIMHEGPSHPREVRDGKQLGREEFGLPKAAGELADLKAAAIDDGDGPVRPAKDVLAAQISDDVTRVVNRFDDTDSVEGKPQSQAQRPVAVEFIQTSTRGKGHDIPDDHPGLVQGNVDRPREVVFAIPNANRWVLKQEAQLFRAMATRLMEALEGALSPPRHKHHKNSTFPALREGLTGKLEQLLAQE